MKESKSYKTYLGYATGIVPPKVARKFKKASPDKKDSVLVPADEEPIQKGKRVKRSTKKSLTTPTTEVALTKEAQMKEVRKKSLKDFYNSHPSGSGSVAENHQVLKRSHLLSQMKELVINQGFDDEDDDKDDDQSEGDEDKGMDSDDVQDKKADIRMTDAQLEKENSEITQEQVVEDAHVIITKKADVPVSSSSRSSDLALKFLNYLDIPLTDTKTVSPLDVHVHHEVPRIHTSTLFVVPVSMPQILLEELSNFALPVIEKMIQESLNQVNLAKTSSQPQSTYEAATTLTKFKLKKILIDKMNSSESYLKAPEHWECYDGLDKDEGPSAGSDQGLKKRKTSKDAVPTTSPKTKDSSSRSSKGTKSQPKSSGKSVYAKELEFEVGDTKTPQALLEKLDWENPKGGDYPFDLSKPLHLITRRNRQGVPVEFFINNDLKYLQEGVSTMTYTTRNQRKTFYAYARGIQSREGVYSTKRILAVTQVLVMRKRGYRYVEEIVVRKADNKLYKFKEGDFPRLRINDIEDMLLFVVQNRLINLSRDDVADFAIAIWMFTRSLVIQNRIEDL
nr:hypothetical protein [Tanacetum cinerariifolium]